MNIIVYTALFTDDVNQVYGNLYPYTHDKDDVSYVAYTNTPNLRSDFWHIEPYELIDNNPRLTARYLKTHPHELFSNYDVWIWMDNSCYFKFDIKDLVSHYLHSYHWAVHRHCDRNCLYQEAAVCKSLNQDPPGVINSQIKRYKNERYPEDNGLFETGILFRRNLEYVAKINEMWWNEISEFSVRDQISFPYIVSEYGDGTKFNFIDETFVAHQGKMGRSQSEHFGTVPRHLIKL